MVVQRTIAVKTKGRGFYDVTGELESMVRASKLETGLCSVFVRHTSASLVIQENADPAVLRDLAAWMARLAPEGSGYEHDAEGPDDMPSHLRCAVTRTSESIPIQEGRLAMGTWQAVYLWEHRAHGHTRHLLVTLIG
jgi:secondary thiamine-phosphate synthase enzyme